jgi:hypothetical protein
MKTTKFLFILLLPMLFAQGVKGQGYEFAPIGASWYYNQYTFGLEINYVKKESIGDTLINGKLCKIIKGTPAWCGDDNMLEYVYQDTNKIFRFNIIDNQFYVLYDFDAGEGDTWTSFFFKNNDTELFTVIVDSISFMYIDTFNVRKLHIRTLHQEVDIGSAIIEKVGSNFYMFPQYAYCDPITGGIRCYMDSIISYQEPPFYTNCDYTNVYVNEFESNLEIQIYPNPAAEKVFINCVSANVHIERIKVYNSIGEIVYNNCFSNAQISELSIEMTRHSKGVYYVTVLLSNNEIQTFKFIKQ